MWTIFSHNVNEQSSTIWFTIFLKQSQTWTHQCEKMTQLAVYFPPLTICKHLQNWTCLKMVTYMGRKVCPLLITAKGVYRETKSTVPWTGSQPTGSCGFPAAALIGQTCSSCCWTERHYWFSTQRTRRLHHCLRTWPTGYLSPVDLCLNAAEDRNTTQRTRETNVEKLTYTKLTKGRDLKCSWHNVHLPQAFKQRPLWIRMSSAAELGSWMWVM